VSSPQPKGRLLGAKGTVTPESPNAADSPSSASGADEPDDQDSEVFFAGASAPAGQATLDLDALLPPDELPTGKDLRQRGTAAPAPIEIPQELGSYRIDGELARGGMGIVLRGRHEVLARDVAIKLLLPTARGDQESFDRFLLEAQATARLRHPGIVAIHDVARDPQGTPYLVMDFIQGQTLRDQIRERGALAPKEVAEIMAAVAEAVQHAHEQGILHRDLKPDNVIMDTKGAPHLTDFGLAKLVQQDAPPRPGGSPRGRLLGGSKLKVDLTNEGAVMGTPRYMAPEQVKGQELTVAADVWALGVMLYEALTGKPPFRGATVIEIFEESISSAPAPPSQLNPLIPARLERICLRCLEKDPQGRPQSAGEVAVELRRELEASKRPLRTAAPPPQIVDGSGVFRFVKVGAFVFCLLAVPLVFGPLRGRWLAPAQERASLPPPSLAPGTLASLEQKADAGDPLSMARWGEHLLVSGGPEEGLDYLEQAADAGETSACLILGQAYEHGQGVEPDRETALAWYRQGSEAGVGRCSVAAGLLLAAEDDPDARSEARDLLEAGFSAIQTNRTASRACLTALGRLYLGVAPRDSARGVECLERAASMGATGAMIELARLFERGDVLERDDEAALNWLERATAGRDAVAWIELGDVYAAGRLGLERDAVRARKAYEQAREERPGVVEDRLKDLR
jgi:serine/threonine protein kinase/TPR repeat protein